jgi:hypothetical protein
MARRADFEEKLNLYKDKIDRDVWRWRKDNIEVDIEDMAKGGEGGPVGGGATIRSKFYPGWRDEDFEDLHDALVVHEKAALLRDFVREMKDIAVRANHYGIDKHEFRDAVFRVLE